jgi:hypothetical protein
VKLRVVLANEAAGADPRRPAPTRRTGADGQTVSPGTRIDWQGPDRTVGDAADTVEAFRAAGAEHLAVHFGDPDGYARRMAAFARATRHPRG